MKRRIDVKPNAGGPKISPESGNHFDPSGEVDIDDRNFHPTLRCENIRIRPGVRMMVSNHVRGRRIHMDYEIDRAPISFSYTLSQRIRCTMRHGLRPPIVAERVPGDSVLAYLPQTRGTIDIFPDRRVVGVSLHFSVSAFKTLFPSLPKCLEHLDADAGTPSTTKPVYRQTRFGAETLHILKQIMECPYAGDTRRLFFEAKALELAAIKMAEWEQKDSAEPANMGRRDVDQIKEAYHILLTQLEAPPSLIDLSRIVGLNRNKLNRGFKALYGDTAFNLLRRARLSGARSLLKNSDLSLSEIAHTVGYNSQANFTTAFRRHYGKTPKIVRREMDDGPADPAFWRDIVQPA
ncbi:AraC family transcriptional regulator [Desulfosarcina ovata subsp. sediminis]|uniref:AraC family transcriptional regulator n=1 Tax=Desulfosarcina ovata subsp. sediminis TaxID=885957 RepID=A0A5K7ZL92_9BACT|nr:AraC family transcriptional regulator [Desulfosarcina ovata]BBO81826.1 AraC family transcriptional regulator [Desulfosarcina ovata subsp. sediminis]